MCKFTIGSCSVTFSSYLSPLFGFFDFLPLELRRDLLILLLLEWLEKFDTDSNLVSGIASTD